MVNSNVDGFFKIKQKKTSIIQEKIDYSSIIKSCNYGQTVSYANHLNGNRDFLSNNVFVKHGSFSVEYNGHETPRYDWNVNLDNPWSVGLASVMMLGSIGVNKLRGIII